jgi:hypothetical protein
MSLLQELWAVMYRNHFNLCCSCVGCVLLLTVQRYCLYAFLFPNSRHMTFPAAFRVLSTAGG